jgi:hypothetical protein
MFPPREKLRAAKLPRPIKTSDGGALSNLEEAADYMLALPERRQATRQWQHVVELIRDGAEVERIAIK